MLSIGGSCDAQKKNHNSASKIVKLDSTTIKNINKDAFDVFVDKYVDSINNAKSENVLPLFLKDPQFDYKYAVWTNLHSPSSLRKTIIERVANCKALKLIIESKDKIYHSVPTKEHDIVLENSQYSNYDFAIYRYKELKCLQ